MFDKITIVGVGLLGGSLAKDLRAKGLAKSIVGVCRSSESAYYALENNVVDAVEPIVSAVVDAEVVVMATPMQQMIPLLQECEGNISPQTILTDVGSVKTDLYRKLTHYTPNLLDQFVLAHPIAGGESSGVMASKESLFSGKNVILTNNARVSEVMHARVQQLWEAVGARVLSMSLEQHDSIFAKTSHLPHVVAFSLVNYLSAQDDRAQLFDLAAAGFYDFTRIASSNAQMWRDICITNQQQVLESLDGYIQQLGQIRENIANADQQAILEYFDAAKVARDTGLLNKEKT